MGELTVEMGIPEVRGDPGDALEDELHDAGEKADGRQTEDGGGGAAVGGGVRLGDLVSDDDLNGMGLTICGSISGSLCGDDEESSSSLTSVFSSLMASTLVSADDFLLMKSSKAELPSL